MVITSCNLNVKHIVYYLLKRKRRKEEAMYILSLVSYRVYIPRMSGSVIVYIHVCNAFTQYCNINIIPYPISLIMYTNSYTNWHALFLGNFGCLPIKC